MCECASDQRKLVLACLLRMALRYAFSDDLFLKTLYPGLHDVVHACEVVYFSKTFS